MAKESIVKNYILNTTYQILNLLAPLVTTPYIARVLGADGVGVYSYTASVVAFFSIFAVLGTTTYGQQVIAQKRDDITERSKYFYEIEILSLITTFLSVLIWLGMLCLDSEYKTLFVILTLELVAVGFDISWFYSGLERFAYIVIPNMLIKIVSIVLLFVLVQDASDVGVYIAILAVSKLLGNLVTWVPLHLFIKKVALRDINILPHVKETLAYFIPTMAASVYSHLDRLMIQWFTGLESENGYYEQANKIFRIAYTMIISVNTVMASRIAYLFAHKKEEEIREKLETAFAFILTIGIACVFGVAAIAPDFVPWFFGEGYDKVITLLIIGSPLIIILSIHNYLAAQYLVPSGQRIRSTKGVLIGAAVNFLCNLVLIPRFYSIGALVGSLIAEISICAVYFWMSRDYVRINWLIKYIPKQLVAGAVMCIVLWWLGSLDISVSIILTLGQVILGIIIYIGILFLTKEKFMLYIWESIKNRKHFQYK